MFFWFYPKDSNPTMTGNGPLMTFTEFEKTIESKGEQRDTGDRREGDVSVAGGQESVEQHLTLVHNKSRRGSFTSHAFPELHHKVSERWGLAPQARGPLSDGGIGSVICLSQPHEQAGRLSRGLTTLFCSISTAVKVTYLSPTSPLSHCSAGRERWGRTVAEHLTCSPTHKAFKTSSEAMLT